VAAVRSPQESAWTFHETLLEVLRHLNQASERRSDVEGVELLELERMMARFWTIEMREQELSKALGVLLENGLAAEENAPSYAWDRQRVLGDRYRITSEGKAYLVRQIQATDRIR
jgi:hypothetical protein